MVFCNVNKEDKNIKQYVTILILVDGFLQKQFKGYKLTKAEVTILILVDGFLQEDKVFNRYNLLKSHNPYFSRWFSAKNTMVF